MYSKDKTQFEAVKINSTNEEAESP